MKTTNMHIYLQGIQIYAYHGVLTQENKVGSYFYIDIDIKTDFSHASQTDELDGTINYAEIYSCIKKEMKTPSKLLENVIRRIAKRLFDKFPSIEEIDIKISKENPPMSAIGQNIGVSAHYIRS